jgi:hypothetical protein
VPLLKERGRNVRRQELQRIDDEVSVFGAELPKLQSVLGAWIRIAPPPVPDRGLAHAELDGAHHEGRTEFGDPLEVAQQLAEPWAALSNAPAWNAAIVGRVTTATQRTTADGAEVSARTTGAVDVGHTGKHHTGWAVPNLRD